jgi:aspartyl-tRNA(Asn)/glutamyl-tRNA(Gln) amidotransferase subunit B
MRRLYSIARNNFVPVIGIETHVQLNTPQKLFSRAPHAHSYDASANASVSAYDAAYPGTLPQLSGVCVKQALRCALALNARIAPLSRFERKHYFYPGTFCALYALCALILCRYAKRIPDYTEE